MADLTKTSALRDSNVDITFTAATPTQTFVASGQDEKVVFYVKNVDATTARININKGDSVQSILGDLKVDVAQNEEKIIGPLTSARFKDKDTGKITVTVKGTDDGTYGGTITNVSFAVIQLP